MDWLEGCVAVPVGGDAESGDGGVRTSRGLTCYVSSSPNFIFHRG